jgi:hypothetical protein
MKQTQLKNDPAATELALYLQQIRLIATLLLLGTLPLSATLTLNVNQKSGANTSISMVKVKTITFSGAKLVINKKDASSSSIALTSMGFLNFTDVSQSVVPLGAKTMIKIFPNPVGDFLNIELSVLKEASASLEIFTLDGRVVVHTLLGNLTNRISVSALAKGLYFCRVQNGNDFSTTKFIKQEFKNE